MKKAFYALGIAALLLVSVVSAAEVNDRVKASAEKAKAFLDENGSFFVYDNESYSEFNNAVQYIVERGWEFPSTELGWRTIISKANPECWVVQEATGYREEAKFPGIFGRNSSSGELDLCFAPGKRRVVVEGGVI